MHTPRSVLRWLPSLALLGCQATTDASDPTVALQARFDQTDARLTAIETKLDGITAQLDASAKKAAEAEKVAQQEITQRKARRDEFEDKRAAREAKRREIRERREASGDKIPLTETLGTREIPGAAEGILCDEGSDGLECSMDRAFLESLLANPAQLTKQARIVPSQRDGETQGYKLYGIRPSSLPKLLGFKNGDMITAVNGEKLASVDQAMALYTKLRRASELDIEFERKGTLTKMRLVIVE